MSAPLVLLVGRSTPRADGVRGPAFAGGRNYIHAIVRAGGVPLIVPPVPDALGRLGDLLDRADAVILQGGGDVDPRRYGQDPIDEVSGIVHDHDEVELAVVAASLERDLPMLAICRGMQVLNVALGGTLVQHLGTDHLFRHHDVALDPDSRIAAAVGSARLEACHSVHHQALDRLGSGLRVVAHADDGTLEAVEHDAARWVVASQWHPEDTADTDPRQQALFDALLRHC